MLEETRSLRLRNYGAAGADGDNGLYWFGLI